jgi:hypothetical protein
MKNYNVLLLVCIALFIDLQAQEALYNPVCNGNDIIYPPFIY